MKTLQTLALCALLLPGLLSCSKENHEAYDAVDALHETYTGRQGAGAADPTSFLQLKLEDHGILLTSSSSKALPGRGSWEISGNRFTGSFRHQEGNVPITLAGIYDPAADKISGTWGYGEFTTGGGSFYVVKEQHKIAVAKKQATNPAGLLLNRLF